MKSVTEFMVHKLIKGIDSKAALVAEGKLPEEIEQSLGESFKLEGDKLKYFVNCLDVAAENAEKLSRILVVSLADGETVPQKATKVEDHYYVPEFQQSAPAVVQKKSDKKDGGGKKGKRKDGPRPSPWGISPEEAAAKKGKGKATSSPAVKAEKSAK